MPSTSKRLRTDPRIRRTERAVVAAARELFETQGYAATTVAQIAERSECAERTVFLRFTSKAHLLERVVDETFAGPSGLGAAPARRPDPEATLDERLRALAESAADALARTGPLFAVAREAEANEPVIAAAFDAARRDTLAHSHRMWRELADDELLDPRVDVDWVADTAGLLASADTYLLMRATIGWSQDQFAAWLHRTWRHLATTPS